MRNGTPRLGQNREAISPTRSTFGSAFEDGGDDAGGGGGGGGGGGFATGAGGGQQRKGGDGKYGGDKGNVGGVSQSQLPSLLDGAPISTRGATHAAAQRAAMAKGRLYPMVVGLNQDGQDRAVSPPTDGGGGYPGGQVYMQSQAEHPPNLAGAITMNGTISPPQQYNAGHARRHDKHPYSPADARSDPRRRTEAEVHADILAQLVQAKAEKAAALQRTESLAAQLEVLLLASNQSSQENNELRIALAKAKEGRPTTPVQHVIETPFKMPSTPPIEAAADDGGNAAVEPPFHPVPEMSDGEGDGDGDGYGDGDAEVAEAEAAVAEAEVAVAEAKAGATATATSPASASAPAPALPLPTSLDMRPSSASLAAPAATEAKESLREYQEYDLSFPVAADYDYTTTTTENYGLPYKENSEFYGKYPHIRALSDYGWHSNYTEERQLWHDRVVDSVVTKTQAQATPWIVYTCGPMGAGKGYALQWMSDNGFFPLNNIVHIDPDHFKSVMPEWQGYTAVDTAIAGSQCHQESGYIQELAQEVAMDKSQNIWVDGSLRNGEWFRTVYDDIRERFPRYRIAIFYVYASEETIRARVKSREEKTGRGVPEQELVDSMQAPDKSLGMLVSKVDFIARIDNNYSVPRLAAFETVDSTGSWNGLKAKFSHTQAHPSEFPSSLAPIWLHKFNAPHDSFAWNDELLAKVTHLGSSEASFLRLSDRMYDASVNLSMSKLRTFLPDVSIKLSPIFPVNLDSESRAAAGIPAKAQSFLYCYGVDLQDDTQHHTQAQRRWSMLKPRWPSMDMVRLGTLSGTKKLGIDVNDPFVALVIHGGYMYFDVANKVCGATAILTAPSTTNDVDDSLLQFRDGECIDVDESAHLVKELCHRFATITIPFMLSNGALRYAWLLPGENFGTHIKNNYGGFLYEFDAQSEYRCRFFPILGA